MDFILTFMLVTFGVWLSALWVALINDINKRVAKVLLALIFWPIGLVVLIIMGFSKVFKTAFGKED